MALRRVRVGWKAMAEAGMARVLQGKPETAVQKVARWALGATLVFAGISHLTFARRAFRAQVPRWVPDLLPMNADDVVVYSGVVEIALGAALIVLGRQRRAVGLVAGSFFVAVFPGNIAQYVHRRSAFGLDTDAKRFARLWFQPALVAWAVWSTGAVGCCGAESRLLGCSRRRTGSGGAFASE